MPTQPFKTQNYENDYVLHGEQWLLIYYHLATSNTVYKNISQPRVLKQYGN